MALGKGLRISFQIFVMGHGRGIENAFLPLQRTVSRYRLRAQ